MYLGLVKDRFKEDGLLGKSDEIFQSLRTRPAVRSLDVHFITYQYTHSTVIHVAFANLEEKFSRQEKEGSFVQFS